MSLIISYIKLETIIISHLNYNNKIITTLLKQTCNNQYENENENNIIINEKSKIIDVMNFNYTNEKEYIFMSNKYYYNNISNIFNLQKNKTIDVIKQMFQK